MAQQGVDMDQEESCCSVSCQDPKSAPGVCPGSPQTQGGCPGSPQTQGGCPGSPQTQGGCPGSPQTQGGCPGGPLSPEDRSGTAHAFRNTELLPADEEEEEEEVEESLKNETDAEVSDGGDRALRPGDVTCDSCTGGPSLKAAKTCLQCLVSYCEDHLRPHYDNPAFKNHRLVPASLSRLDEKLFCSRHGEEKKVFCRTDLQCICYLCSMDDHRGHDTVSAVTERAQRQRELGERRQDLRVRIQQREEEAEALRREVESIDRSADRAVLDSEAVFAQLVSSVERRRCEVIRLIREQQQREVRRAQGQRERAEAEVAELRARHARLEGLELTQDHVQFLRGLSSLEEVGVSLQPSVPAPAPGSGPHSPPPPLSRLFDGSARPGPSKVSNSTVKPEDILQVLGTHVSEAVNRVHAFLSSTSPPPNPLFLPDPPRTRAEFLRYWRPMALDPNTAEVHLYLSRGNRKVRRTPDRQPYAPHPDRFTRCRQVLSGGEALSGRRYWEVSWTGSNVYIAVAYGDISRTGLFSQSCFGYNDVSWSLQCYEAEYVFRHANVATRIPGPAWPRVGVYLDHGAGLLCFYGVSDADDTVTLLHRVRTAFTQELHTGFYVSRFIGASAELCDLSGLTTACS